MSQSDARVLHKSCKSFASNAGVWNRNCSFRIGIFVSIRNRIYAAIALLATACVPAAAATLEQLSLDQLAQNATSIVRATVAGSYANVVNSTVYTHYTLRVSDNWKGVPATEVMVPGGVAGNLRQVFPGVPELVPGTEYVLFLWRSSTGITHLLGLTQGLYQVERQSDGTDLATRAKIGEMMLDAAGRKVADRAIILNLNEMRSKVRLAAGSGLAR